MYEIRKNDFEEKGEESYTIDNTDAPVLSDSCIILTKSELLKLYYDIGFLLENG